MNEFLVSGLRKLVEKAADDFDPALLSELTALRAIEEWALIEKLASAQKLRSADQPKTLGLMPTAAVAESSGVTAGAAAAPNGARRKAKPKTRAAFDKGKLSPRRPARW